MKKGGHGKSDDRIAGGRDEAAGLSQEIAGRTLVKTHRGSEG